MPNKSTCHQLNIFDMDDFATPCERPVLKLGNSLLTQGAFKTGVAYRGVVNIREVKTSEHVDVYRNLNRKDCFSIRPREGIFKGKVSGYSPCVIVKNPKFITSLASQKRVIATGQKSVHAYIRAEFVDALDEQVNEKILGGFVRVSYNPHFSPYFFVCERDGKGAVIEASVEFIKHPPQGYPYAIVSGSDVKFVKDIVTNN